MRMSRCAAEVIMTILWTLAPRGTANNTLRSCLILTKALQRCAEIDADIELCAHGGELHLNRFRSYIPAPARRGTLSNPQPNPRPLTLFQTLVLVGIYRINVTKGTISISGAILSESTPTQTVYAPMTHALPVIEAPSSKRKRTASEKPTGAEIRITSHHSGLLDIGKLCPTFNTIWRGPSKNTTAHTFAPIFTSFSNIPTITVHKAWKPTLTALTEKANSFEGRPPTIVLAGSKSTGKSTLTRILANRLLTSSSDLTSIAYLDLDPGQPEFSPPGTISLTHLHTPLLGPSFTHALTPTRIHHTGYTTPKDDPGHYIRSTLDLLLTHRQTNPTTPLLINTTGWTKGLGLELLHDILTHSRATDIIFLGHLAQNPLSDPTPAGQATLYTLPPAAPTIPARFSPADLRSLQTMSHFHRLAGDWDFSRPLTGIAPWVVPYTAPSQGIDAVHILGEHIPADELRTAIEGTIVAVVLVSKHNLPEAFSSSPTVLSSGTVLPAVLDTSLGPEISSCAGLAVLRCIDAAQQTVQLVTAIPDEAVAAWEREGKRVVLVRGRLELSGWEMAVAGGAAGGEMPWVSSGEGKKAAGAVWRVRRNVMRRGQQ